MLTLCLEREKTVIYVNGIRFNQCKHLLIVLPSSPEYLEFIDSIDAVEENFIWDYKEKIPPEVEFWGHCSNLQAWTENNYDTRLLHRSLAFPLLKRLADSGDPLAKIVFKEEIANRFSSGSPNVVNFLIIHGYLDVLTSEELNLLLENNHIKIRTPKHIKPFLKNLDFEILTDLELIFMSKFEIRVKDFNKNLIEKLFMVFEDEILFDTFFLNKNILKNFLCPLLLDILSLDSLRDLFLDLLELHLGGDKQSIPLLFLYSLLKFNKDFDLELVPIFRNLDESGYYKIIRDHDFRELWNRKRIELNLS